MLSDANFRRAEKTFAIEGPKLLAEAADAGLDIQSVFVAPEATDAIRELAQHQDAHVHWLERGVLERLPGTTTPQPVIATASFIDSPVSPIGSATAVLVCVGIQDPANVGAIVRSAEASGADRILFCEGCADPYNPKTLRASAGSLFHVPFNAGLTVEQALSETASAGLERLATTVTGGEPYFHVDLTKPFALFLGNEANGLAPSVIEQADRTVSIPMAGRTESLNVAMASTAVCFEAARQKAIAK